MCWASYEQLDMKPSDFSRFSRDTLIHLKQQQQQLLSICLKELAFLPGQQTGNLYSD